jgi:hypothetical protein
MRLPEGFMATDYSARTGLSVDTLEGRLAVAEARGLIESFDGPGWRPTALGLRFLNDLTATFLP